jgi:hypothetical protein
MSTLQVQHNTRAREECCLSVNDLNELAKDACHHTAGHYIAFFGTSECLSAHRIQEMSKLGPRTTRSSSAFARSLRGLRARAGTLRARTRRTPTPPEPQGCIAQFQGDLHTTIAVIAHLPPYSGVSTPPKGLHE